MTKSKWLTIPNLLSLLRLMMIPLFSWLYLRGKYNTTALVLLLSGLTDVADGWYARRFNAVSEVGKALDPIADKLTQAAMLLCLITNHPLLLAPFTLLLIKEISGCIAGVVVIRRTGIVPAAVWHGKITTLLLYLLMLIHVVWKDIPLTLSNVFTGLCVLMMLLSMTLYAIRNARIIRNADRKGSHL